MEEKQQAEKVYQTMVKSLKEHELKFEEDIDKLTIAATMQGDDLPVKFIVRVIPKTKLIQFISPMFFNMPEDKRIDGAIAVAVANYGLLHGSFDYDIDDGEIRFRMTTSYIDSEIGEELFYMMVGIAVATCDKYNDRFMMLAKGLINIEKFIEQEQGE